MSKFESIFAKSDELDSNLNKLFNTRVELNPKTEESEEEVEETNEKKSTRPKKGKKKFDAEKEGKTIFVGNLQPNCKKEVANHFTNKMFKNFFINFVSF